MGNVHSNDVLLRGTGGVRREGAEGLGEEPQISNDKFSSNRKSFQNLCIN